MKEQGSAGIQWRRLLAESVAVVLSILLAFAIDAWWDARQEAGRERDLLDGLRTDFESSRPGLEGRLTLARRMAAGTVGLLARIEGRGSVPAVVVPDSLILAVLGGPTYEPATNTLDAALASGEIELLESTELRTELANWRRLLSDTREDELEVRRVTNEQLVPELARSVDLGPFYGRVLAWSGGDPYGAGRRIPEEDRPASASAVRLPVTTELIGALALRRFYVEFAAADLAELLESLDRVLALVEAEAAR
jgi:hypothetical protein